MPRLLDSALMGNRLREKGRLRPAALSAEMNLDAVSHVDMVLKEDDLPVAMHDFVEVYGQNGSLGVFRVANIATDCRKQRRIRLNHALDVFADAVISGEGSISGTVRQVLERLMEAQTAAVNGIKCWRLGTVEDSAACCLENRYENALACLYDLAAREAEYGYSFDFSEFPWRLDFLRRSDAVVSEFRLPRNVENCSVTVDDSGLCTRLYLSAETADADGAPVTALEIHEDAAGKRDFGIVEKAAEIRAAEVPDKAEWIARYFAQHAQPSVQLEIDGTELNRLTGERLDEMHLGGICRVALPDIGRVFSERIVSVRYPDILRQPARVTVSLANKRQDAGGLVAGIAYRAGSTARSVTRNEREIIRNRYRWTAADRHITQYGDILHRAGLEIDPHGVWLYASEDGPNYALGASFKVQADAITAEVSRATAAEDEAYSRIRQTADAITAEVSRATASEGNLSTRITQTADSITSLAQKSGVAGLQEGETLFSRITQNAESITSEVGRATAAEETIGSRITQTEDSITAEVTRATAAEGALSARITVNAEGITSKVSKGDISSTINQTAQGVQIQAGKIDLSGYTSLQTFNAAQAGYAQSFTTVDLYPTNTYTGLLSATNLYVGNQGSPTQATWQTKSVVTSVNHYDITVKNADGENVKVTKINSVNSTTIYYLGHS